jgi:hypothetical protein
MKTIISVLLLMTSLSVRASDPVWCLVTNTGVQIPLSNVSYIFMDGNDAETFTIVPKTGSQISGVGKATVEQLDPTKISLPIMADGQPMLQVESNSICISGCEVGLPVAVYTVGGNTVLQGKTQSGSTVLDIVELPKGIYVLKVGNTSLKFSRK